MRQKQAQTIGEYVVLMTVVVSAFTAMQVYAKRGIQTRLKEMADEFSEDFGGQVASGVQVNPVKGGGPISSDSHTFTLKVEEDWDPLESGMSTPPLVISHSEPGYGRYKIIESEGGKIQYIINEATATGSDSKSEQFRKKNYK